MAGKRLVTAKQTFVAVTGGGYVKVEEGDQRPATDAVVKANPTLFTATTPTKT